MRVLQLQREQKLQLHKEEVGSWGVKRNPPKENGYDLCIPLHAAFARFHVELQI